jgi:hypothetical protein
MSARPKLFGDPDFVDPLLALGRQPDPVIGQQEDCAICGLVEAGCFGFGVFRRRRGIWACEDLECRAVARARSRTSVLQLVAAE